MQTKKRVLSILLTLALALGLLAIAPITAHAATGMATINISTLGSSNANNVGAASTESQWNYIAGSHWLQLTTASGNYKLTGTNTNLCVYVMPAASGANVTLSGVNISYPDDDSEAFQVGCNNCTLTLDGNNTVRNTGANIGIYGGAFGQTTTVTSTSGGTLTVMGGANSYGFYITGGTLRITGNASVTAVGGSGQRAMTETSSSKVFLGDDAKLKMVNNHASLAEKLVFEKADPTTTHMWQLTDATSTDPLTYDSIAVSVASGTTATIERRLLPPTMPFIEFDEGLWRENSEFFYISVLAYQHERMYALALPSGSAAPNAAQIKSQGVYLGNGSIIDVFTFPNPTSALDIYLVGESASILGLFSNIIMRSVPAFVAPALSAGTVNRTSDTAATIGFTANVYGTAYYLVKNSGDAAPTAAQVVAGTMIGSIAPGAVTGKAVTLTAGAKDIYVVLLSNGFDFSDVLKIPVAAYVPPATPVTFTAAQTGGASGTADSTGIALTFSQAVTGLTAGDITITNGTGAVTKGTLSGSGTAWTIGLSSVAAQGNVTVSVASFGTFNVTTGAQTVAVYKNTVVPPTNVTFTAAQTGGASGTADSTGIALTFSQAVTGLTAGDITITNGTGAVTKGTLAGSGTAWTIGLASVATQGSVTVSVANFGTFNVTTGAQTVAVYKNNTVPTTPVTFTAAQTGGVSGTADSTGIALTFSQAVTGLVASNITITNGTGAVTKGTLSGSGTAWTIGLSAVAAQGSVTVSVASFGTFNVTTGAQTVAVYKNTAATAPAAPGGFTATAGNGQVTLAWATPGNGGSAITKYQYQQNGGAWTDIPGSGAGTTSYTVTGLANGTSYSFAVRAVNAVGSGASSAAQSAKPTAPAKKIFTTKYDSNFWNWLLFIVCFGWIWMWFV